MTDPEGQKEPQEKTYTTSTPAQRAGSWAGVMTRVPFMVATEIAMAVMKKVPVDVKNNDQRQHRFQQSGPPEK